MLESTVHTSQQY